MEAGSQRRPGRAGEDPSLTPNRPLPAAWGTIVLIDIDKLSDIVEERGWSEYSPNPATGLLSALVDSFARKWSAIIVYGLDWERGTEEAVIEIPEVDAEQVADDLISIARELEKENVTATIVAITGPLVGRPTRSRREAYQGPRRAAKRILEKLKRRGGGIVYVNGRIVYTSGRLE